MSNYSFDIHVGHAEAFDDDGINLGNYLSVTIGTVHTPNGRTVAEKLAKKKALSFCGEDAVYIDTDSETFSIRIPDSVVDRIKADAIEQFKAAQART